MRSMSLHTSHEEVLQATEHLPDGATLVIHEFEWEEYERLLEVLEDRPKLRVSYDCGRLEILSPSVAHEQFTRLMDFIVYVFCEVFELKVRCFGQSTMKSKALAKGVEPDALYYVKSVELIRGKFDIVLGADPPPDIAVEIDFTKRSLRKLPIYAALKISEFWRYDGKKFTIYALTDQTYSPIPESRFLPGLTEAMLKEVMEAARTGDTMDVIKAFRKRVQELRACSG